MSNFLLFPIIIPFFIAMVLLFFQKHVVAQRIIALLGFMITAVIAFIQLLRVFDKGIQTITFGSWPAPFGITMVSDSLSALLVFTTSLLMIFIVLYSIPIITKKREMYFYYPALFMITTGINGAFTTGDIFNLFVFFEVLLIASYLLIVLGGERAQLRDSFKYILVNVISSALFVITVAFLYAVVGTLNMADIAQKITDINQPGIVTTIAVLFLAVFGLKAAIFPLYYWLPMSYSAAPIPVLVLFGALLTKVGVYAITRTYTLFFVHETAFTHELLLALALITLLVGAIGALAHYDVKQIIIYNIVIAVGVILYGVAVLNPTSLAGAVNYLIHDMLIKAALFMLIGIIITITGTSDLKKMGGLMKTHPTLAWFYLIAAFSLAGIPPLSGFVGKYLIIKGGFEAGAIISASIILLSSLLVLLSVMRIFIYAFWGESKATTSTLTKSKYLQLFVPTVVLVFITIFYGTFAELIMPYIDAAADVLANPTLYIEAVFKGDDY